MGERSRELTILITGDILCFVVSLYATLLVRYVSIPSSELLSAHIGPFLFLSCIWLFIFYIGGLYDKQTVFLKGILFSRIINTQFVNILIAALIFLIVPFGIAPKTNLVLYLVISIILITLWRLKLYNRFSPKQRHKAILIADGQEAIELVDEVNNNERYNYSFVRIIDNATAAKTDNFEKKLVALIEQEGITMIVANPKGEYIERVMPQLYHLAFVQFEFTFLDFYKAYEDTFDRVPLSCLHYNWFIEHVSQSKSIVYDVAKRMFDVVGSLCILLLLGIIVPFVYIANRIEGKGPLTSQYECTNCVR
jgi:membrane protein implicated in regulation of membrane protease activity